MTNLVGLFRAPYVRQIIPPSPPVLAMPVAMFSDGDSNTSGSGASNGGYPQLFSAAVNVEALDIGVVGESLATMNTNIAANVAYFKPLGYKVVTCEGGTIDLGTGSTAASLQATMQAYCASVRAGGMLAVPCTILARGDYSGTWTAAKEAQRKAYNAFLRFNFMSFADSMIDFDVIPQAQNPNDPTYYQADLIHPTNQLQALMALKMQSVFSTVSNTTFTFNPTPLAGGSATFSQGNEVVLTTTPQITIISANSISGLKVFAVCLEVTPSANAGGIGIATAAAGAGLGFDANLSWGYYVTNGSTVQNSAFVISPSTGLPVNSSSKGGSIMGLVVNQTAKTLWLTVDGVNFYGSSVTALTLAQVNAGTGGYSWSAIAGTVFAGAAGLTNAGQQLHSVAYPWTLPTGYSQLA